MLYSRRASCWISWKPSPVASPVERGAVVSEGAEVGAAMIKEDNIFARGAKVKRIIGLHGRSVVAVEEIGDLHGEKVVEVDESDLLDLLQKHLVQVQLDLLPPLI